MHSQSLQYRDLLADPETTGTIEKHELDLGFIPLTDCAPLVVAHEKGFFERNDLRVTLHREASWASIRDKVIYDVFDAAHMLYTMPLALTLGVSGPSCPMASAICLSAGGNAITVSQSLYEELQAHRGPNASSAEAIKAVITSRYEASGDPLTFGVVYPTSTHHYELRYWLANAGIDPDNDVRILVIPPPEMPQWLRSGRVDGFCVGEPWNAFAVQRGWGRVLITKQELWNSSPEKVLGVTQEWANTHPGTHLALVRSLIEACAWLDDRSNREETARILAQPYYVDAPYEVVRNALLGQIQYAQDDTPTEMQDFMVFHRYATNFPWRSHAIWYLTQMRRWGHIEDSVAMEQIAQCVAMPELYRLAASQLGVPVPMIDMKSEGIHDDQWALEQASEPIQMGPDRLMDGGQFDPNEPGRYLAELAKFNASNQTPRPTGRL